jgi:ankyrin repeat protein/TPR repeat protein
MNLLRYVLLLIMSPLVFPSYAVTQDLSLKNNLSLEEKKELKIQTQNLKKASDALKAMEMLILYETLKKGNCEQLLEVEAKAKQGSSDDQFVMSDIYHQGLCVKKNDKESFSWLQKAANQDHLMAMHDLAIYFKLGRGIEQNLIMTAHWFKKAALAGDRRSQSQLASLYQEGKGVPQNYLEAKKWYQKAAEQGEHIAAFKLSVLLIGGKLGSNDFKEAIKWSLPFAERGYPVSQLLVANLLRVEGSRDNAIQGHKWANLASKTNDEDTKKEALSIRSNFEKSLSAVDILRAQELAKNWKPIAQNTPIATKSKANSIPTISNDITPSQAKAKLTKLGVEISKSAYFKSVKEDNLEFLKLFHIAGTNLETKSVRPPGLTALYFAVDHGSFKVYRYLMDNKVNINVVNSTDGQTPLVRALAHERWEIVDELMKLGADVSQQPESINGLLPGTALSYAVMSANKTNLVEKILKKGASANEKYHYKKETIIFFAVRSKSLANIRLLLQYGADINQLDWSGYNPLMIAIAENSPSYDVINLLLSSGANYKHRSRSWTPLNLAIFGGNSKIVSLLLQYGADANEYFKIPSMDIPFSVNDELTADLLINGGSSLMLACAKEHASIVKELLEAGASLETSIKGKLGTHTALSISQKTKNQAILNLLANAKE